MKNLDVLIGLISQGTWTSEFGLSLASLVADFHQPIEGYELQNLDIMHKQGTILPQMRHQCLQAAIESHRTHLLFIDVDQNFPHYAMRKLLSHDRPVVACNIAVKKFPSCPTARKYSEETDKGIVVYSLGAQKELEQVWRIGCGIMLIDVQAIKKVPPPWFDNIYKSDAGDYQGEDWTFCAKLQQYGIKIYVDHELSVEVGHVGKLLYTHDLIVPASGRFIDPIDAVRRAV